MTRVTKKSLQSQVHTLNMLLERPLEQFSSKPGESTKFSVGHLNLDHNGYGYQLEEQTSAAGGTAEISPRLTAGEMDLMLRGMMRGIGLRNAHIGEMLLRNELVKAGLTTAQGPLYNQDTHDLSEGQLMQKQAEHRQRGIQLAQELGK